MAELKNDEDNHKTCKVCWTVLGVWQCDNEHYYCHACKMRLAADGKTACQVQHCVCCYLRPTADNKFTYLGINVDISTLQKKVGLSGTEYKGVIRIKTRSQCSCGIVKNKIAAELNLDAATLGLFKDGKNLSDKQLLHEASISDNMKGISCEYRTRLLLELDATTVRNTLKPTFTLSARISSKLISIKKEICNHLGINENHLSLKLVGERSKSIEDKYLTDDMLLLDAGVQNFSKLELEVNSYMPGQHRVTGVGISVCSNHPLVEGNKSVETSQLGPNELVTVEKVIGPYALISQPVKGWIILYNRECKPSIARTDEGFYKKGEEVFGFYRRPGEEVGKWYLASIQGCSEDQATYLIKWNSSKFYTNIPVHSIRKDTRRKILLDLSNWGTVRSNALAPGFQGPVLPPTKSEQTKSTLQHTRASMQVPLNWTLQRVGEMVGQQILVNYNIIRFRLPGEKSLLPTASKISALEIPVKLEVVEVSSQGPNKSVKGYKRLNFKLNERIEAKSHRKESFGKWFTAKVIKVKKSQIKIHWLEFDEKEWITSPKWSAMLRRPEKKHQYKVGDKVKVKRTAGNWKAATIYENLGDDSYHVKFNDEQEVNIWAHPVEDIKMDKVGVKRRSSL